MLAAVLGTSLLAATVVCGTALTKSLLGNMGIIEYCSHVLQVLKRETNCL